MKPKANSYGGETTRIREQRGMQRSRRISLGACLHQSRHADEHRIWSCGLTTASPMTIDGPKGSIPLTGSTRGAPSASPDILPESYVYDTCGHGTSHRCQC